MVTDTPGAIEAIGGDELLYVDGRPRGGAYVAIRTQATSEVGFAVVGSLTDSGGAERLAAKYEHRVDDSALMAPAARYWERVTRGLRIMDQTAFTLCSENKLPMIVFGMETEGNILRVVQGERIGTLVSAS